MRIAVMSDIHGFSIALRTVLEDMARRGPFDAVVAAGDFCEVGPDPSGCLQLLATHQVRLIQGNTDRDIAACAKIGCSDAGLRFVVDAIGVDRALALGDLPLTMRFSPTDRTADDLLVCHANPHDLERKLLPELTDRELRERLLPVSAGAIAFGHHHVAFTRSLDGMLLVDVSAVGNPKDEDLRCKYAILTWEQAAKGWSAEIIRLPYPLQETLEQIRQSDLPKPERTARKLLHASYRPMSPQ